MSRRTQVSGTATITSKGQLTIPIAVVRKPRLRRGDKVLLEADAHGSIIGTVARTLVEDLAGRRSPTHPRRR